MSFGLNLTTLDTGLNAIEGVFNLVGYCPNFRLSDPDYDDDGIKKHDFKEFKGTIAKLRYNYGQILIVVGLAASAISFGVSLAVKSQTTFYREVSVKSLQYAGHGLLNIVRSFLEKYELGFLTLAYDLYGQKFLPYQTQFDLQAKTFTYIKQQLNHLNIPNLIPSAANKLASFLRV